MIMTSNPYTPGQKAAIWSVAGIFTLVYCSISLVNHYCFRTNAYDLGIYNNMLYSYAHLKLNYTSIQQPGISHAFSDHFEPVFFLFAPFYWIFGSYTLLIIQVALVIAGGLGAMKYARLYSGSNLLSLAVLIQFYATWGVYSALAFDFHNNVTGAMLVPWFMVFAHRKEWKKLLLVWVAMLISKENIALYTVFVCLGAALHYFRDAGTRKKLLGLSGLSALYFIIVVKLIIPSFAQENAGYLYEGMYQALGDSPSDVITNLFTKPGRLFSELFENYKDPFYNGIKSELHFSVLVSGGIFLLYRPQFLVMLIPVYLQKLYNYDPSRWGINYHYSIEFVPVLSICTAVFLTSLKHARAKTMLAFGLAAVTICYTISVIDQRVSVWYDKVNTCFYYPLHYDMHARPSEIRKELSVLDIPGNAPVSAQTTLVPHLAGRDSIYMYPNVSHARYIVLAPALNTYPLRDQYQASLDTLRSSSTWKLVSEQNGVIVFKR